MKLMVKMNPAWGPEEISRATETRKLQVEYLRAHDPEFLQFLGEMKKRFGGFESVDYQRVDGPAAVLHDGGKPSGAMHPL